MRKAIEREKMIAMSRRNGMFRLCPSSLVGSAVTGNEEVWAVISGPYDVSL